MTSKARIIEERLERKEVFKEVVVVVNKRKVPYFPVWQYCLVFQFRRIA
ncbi:MAG: hypothetical protein UX17_C0020G0010 [Parcubacteria group bacterium GW2011_GWC2_45_7]|nr:MAG: hypothetical protein UX17_C0020G0010 [Parcubacteria group bacterium GW2011_GWC2_45_7]KKU73191.1 MAG: hypothetical protein UX98_C0010G0033 [Parcubacteria group bacterium GW2011_GWA2_47_26]